MCCTRQSKLAKRRLSSEEARRQHWQWFDIPNRLHADDKILISMIQRVAIQFWIIGVDLKTILALCWGTETEQTKTVNSYCNELSWHDTAFNTILGT